MSCIANFSQNGAHSEYWAQYIPKGDGFHALAYADASLYEEKKGHHSMPLLG
jgi:hypothetical protein